MSDLKLNITVTMPVEVYESLMPKKDIDNLISSYNERVRNLRDFMKTVEKDSIDYKIADAKIDVYEKVTWDLLKVNP